MGSNGNNKNSTSRLLLDYIRTFMWPTVVLSLLLVYKGDVLQIMKTREFDIAGILHVGQAIDELDSEVKIELAEIRELADEVSAESAGTISIGGSQTSKAEDLTEKIDALEKNWTRELSEIQQAAITQSLSNQPDAWRRLPAQAKVWELEGFDYLIEKDVDKSIEAFERAEAIAPDYHNVAEIKGLLEEQRDKLERNQPDENWTSVNRALVTKYSWGMPSDVRRRLREE